MMQWTIDNYLDRARANAGLDSDRKLGREIGLTGSAISNLRLRKSVPKDETIAKLAVMAGRPLDLALLDRDIWNSHGVIRATYQEIARKLAMGLGRAAAAITILVLAAGAILQPSPQVSAATDGEQSNFAKGGVYIMENGRRKLLKLLAFLLDHIAAYGISTKGLRRRRFCPRDALRHHDRGRINVPLTR
jgi:transcriptional regulator with XRE-family HTH domain